MDTCKKNEWEAALASAEFYFKPPSSNSPVYKMQRIDTATFFCARADEEFARGAKWSIRGIREFSKYWTLVDNPNKQEKTNVNDNGLYQKINAKEKQLRGLNDRRDQLFAQANEIHALIVKGERQLVELKRELLRELKKELGS